MKNIAKKDEFGRRLIEVGEIVPLMVQKMGEGLHRCIADNEHRREPYWILYSADWYGNGTELRDTFTPFKVCPIRLLNTICWRVDNKTGKCEEIWVLPKDAPVQDTDETGVFDETLIKSVNGIPIIY